MGHSETHRAQHQRFNDRDFEAMIADLAPDFHFEDVPRGLMLKNVDDFRAWIESWPAAFSDARVDSGLYLDGEDFSVGRFHARGTNDGPLGPFAGMGRTMDLPMCEVLRYDAAGKVVSGELYYDQVSMLAQLGHIEAPG
jgi:hypothetical protein